MLAVRPMKESDIPLIVRYWDNQTPDDLERMNINPEKMLSSEERRERMRAMLSAPPEKRERDILIWEVDGEPVGLTSLANIRPGEDAEIHLHMFEAKNRRRGLGGQLFLMACREFARKHALKKIICQPAAANPAPNAMFKKLGIPVARTYRTTPSPICSEHEVNRYEIDVGSQ